MKFVALSVLASGIKLQSDIQIVTKCDAEDIWKKKKETLYNKFVDLLKKFQSNTDSDEKKCQNILEKYDSKIKGKLPDHFTSNDTSDSEDEACAYKNNKVLCASKKEVEQFVEKECQRLDDETTCKKQNGHWQIERCGGGRGAGKNLCWLPECKTENVVHVNNSREIKCAEGYSMGKYAKHKKVNDKYIYGDGKGFENSKFYYIGFGYASQQEKDTVVERYDLDDDQKSVKKLCKKINQNPKQYQFSTDQPRQCRGNTMSLATKIFMSQFFDIDKFRSLTLKFGESTWANHLCPSGYSASANWQMVCENQLHKNPQFTIRNTLDLDWKETIKQKWQQAGEAIVDLDPSHFYAICLPNTIVVSSDTKCNLYGQVSVEGECYTGHNANNLNIYTQQNRADTAVQPTQPKVTSFIKLVQAWYKYAQPDYNQDIVEALLKQCVSFIGDGLQIIEAPLCGGHDLKMPWKLQKTYTVENGEITLNVQENELPFEDQKPQLDLIIKACQAKNSDCDKIIEEFTTSQLTDTTHICLGKSIQSSKSTKIWVQKVPCYDTVDFTGIPLFDIIHNDGDKSEIVNYLMTNSDEHLTRKVNRYEQQLFEVHEKMDDSAQMHNWEGAEEMNYISNLIGLNVGFAHVFLNAGIKKKPTLSIRHSNDDINLDTIFKMRWGQRDGSFELMSKSWKEQKKIELEWSKTWEKHTLDFCGLVPCYNYNNTAFINHLTNREHLSLTCPTGAQSIGAYTIGEWTFDVCNFNKTEKMMYNMYYFYKDQLRPFGKMWLHGKSETLGTVELEDKIIELVKIKEQRFKIMSDRTGVWISRAWLVVNIALNIASLNPAGIVTVYKDFQSLIKILNEAWKSVGRRGWASLKMIKKLITTLNHKNDNNPSATPYTKQAVTYLQTSVADYCTKFSWCTNYKKIQS